MESIKYKSNEIKDEVWINMMGIDSILASTLQRLFGPIPSPLPRGVLVVKFYVYKNKPSWIEINGERIDFTYNIVNTLKEGEWLISFNVKQKITRGIDILTKIVKYDCTSKKNLIKELIEQLIIK